MNEKLVNAAQVAQKEVAALQEKMDLAAKMYQAGREAEGAVLLQEAAVLTRNMSDRYRDLLMSSGNPDYAARLEQIMAEVHPVQIGFTEQGWFGVRMEPLALDRETASKEYIRSIIYPAMRNFFADKDTVRYDRCTVAYRHILDADLPVTGRPDYTNAEIKMVTDTVAMYVMVDDNPVRCRLSHTCIPGANAHTEVYVIPQEDFVEWVKLEDTIPDEGLPLTDQVPERWKVDM